MIVGIKEAGTGESLRPRGTFFRPTKTQPFPRPIRGDVRDPCTEQLHESSPERRTPLLREHLLWSLWSILFNGLRAVTEHSCATQRVHRNRLTEEVRFDQLHPDHR
jgi:hypothetical protein